MKPFKLQYILNLPSLSNKIFASRSLISANQESFAGYSFDKEIQPFCGIQNNMDNHRANTFPFYDPRSVPSNDALAGDAR